MRGAKLTEQIIDGTLIFIYIFISLYFYLSIFSSIYLFVRYAVRGEMLQRGAKLSEHIIIGTPGKVSFLGLPPSSFKKQNFFPACEPFFCQLVIFYAFHHR